MKIPYLDYLIKNSIKTENEFYWNVLIHFTKISGRQMEEEWNATFSTSKPPFIFENQQNLFSTWSWKIIADFCFSKPEGFSKDITLDPVRTLRFLDLIRNLSTHVHYFYSPHISALKDYECLSQEVIDHAKQKDQPYAVLFAQSRWISASDVARKTGFKSGDPRSQAEQWEKEGLIFSIDHDCGKSYPLYAFDPNQSYHPISKLKEILGLLSPHKTPLVIGFWFASLNATLAGRRPMDVLLSEPLAVLAAAKNEVQPHE